MKFGRREPHPRFEKGAKRAGAFQADVKACFGDAQAQAQELLGFFDAFASQVLLGCLAVVAFEQPQQVELGCVAQLRKPVQRNVLVQVLVDVMADADNRIQLPGIGVTGLAYPLDFALVKGHGCWMGKDKDAGNDRP